MNYKCINSSPREAGGRLSLSVCPSAVHGTTDDDVGEPGGVLQPWMVVVFRIPIIQYLNED